MSKRHTKRTPAERSAEAARLSEPTAKQARALVFRLLHAATSGPDGGMTDDELFLATPRRMCESTVRPRRIELAREGLVVDSGRERKTRRGRWATVWAVR